MGPRPITFNVVPTDDSSIEPTEDDLMDSDKSPQQEFMMWHQRLNHLSYQRMQLMVQEGVLPSHLGCPSYVLDPELQSGREGPSINGKTGLTFQST